VKARSLLAVLAAEVVVGFRSVELLPSPAPNGERSRGCGEARALTARVGREAADTRGWRWKERHEVTNMGIKNHNDGKREYVPRKQRVEHGPQR